MKNAIIKAVLFVSSLALGSQALQANILGKQQVYLGIHPLEVAVGTIGADLSVSVSDYWTVGLEGTHTEFYRDHQGAKGSSIGANASYFFNTAMLDSGYIKLSGDRGRLAANIRDDETKETDHSYTDMGGVSLIPGYHWAFANGVSVNAGVGVRYSQIRSNATKGITRKFGRYEKSLPSHDYKGVTPTGEFSVAVAM